MAPRRWTAIVVLFSVILTSRFHSSSGSPTHDADETIWNPEVFKSLEELIVQCLGDRIPAREVRKIGSEFLGKRAIAPETAGAGSDGSSSEPADPVDWNSLCQNSQGRPVLQELCRWMTQEQSPLQEPIDCDMIFDPDNRTPSDVDDYYPVDKRGLGAVLMSGKRMNRDNRRAMGSEFLGKRALGSEFLGKRAMGSEFLGKRAMGSEFLGKRAMGSEFLGKRAMGSEFLGKRAMGSEFLGKRAMGSEFLGKRAMGSEFLGKRAMGSEFLGKRAYHHPPDSTNVDLDEADQLTASTNQSN